MNPAPTGQDLAGWHPTGSYKDAILEGIGFRGWPDYFARRQLGAVWGVKAHSLLFVRGMLKDFFKVCPAERRVLIWTTRDADEASRSWNALRPELSAPECRDRIGDQITRLASIYGDWPEADRLAIAFPATATDPRSQLEGVANLVGVPFSDAACAHIQADIPRWS